MIKLTTLDKREIYLNPELIEQLESVPESLITLTTGKKLLVYEPLAEIVLRIINYRKQIHGVEAPDGLEVNKFEKD